MNTSSAPVIITTTGTTPIKPIGGGEIAQVFGTESLQLLNNTAPKQQSSTLSNLLNQLASGSKIHVESTSLLGADALTKQENTSLLTFSIQNKVQISGAAASAGLVVWALNSGGILSSVLATVPVWKNLDPISLLDSRGDEEEGLGSGDEDDEDKNSEESAADVLAQ